MNNPYREPIVKGYRERLLKVLVASDIYQILHNMGEPSNGTSALEARQYLLANWNEDIRDSVMTIIKRNIELETWI
jgi:hypothetical protein